MVDGPGLGAWIVGARPYQGNSRKSRWEARGARPIPRREPSPSVGWSMAVAPALDRYDRAVSVAPADRTGPTTLFHNPRSKSGPKNALLRAPSDGCRAFH